VGIPNALGAIVLREQKVFSRRLKAASVEFGLWTGSGRLPGGRTRNGKSRAAVGLRVESVTWYVYSRFRSARTEMMSLAMDCATQWSARYCGHNTDPSLNRNPFYPSYDPQICKSAVRILPEVMSWQWRHSVLQQWFTTSQQRHVGNLHIQYLHTV